MAEITGKKGGNSRRSGEGEEEVALPPWMFHGFVLEVESVLLYYLVYFVEEATGGE